MICNHMVEIQFIHNNYAPSKVLAIIVKFSKTSIYHKLIKRPFAITNVLLHPVSFHDKLFKLNPYKYSN